MVSGHVNVIVSADKMCRLSLNDGGWDVAISLQAGSGLAGGDLNCSQQAGTENSTLSILWALME